MRVTEPQRKMLGELMHWAFVEIRMLGSAGKSEQAADLADAFHKLPMDMWEEDFSLEQLRDEFLADYQAKYPESGPKNYVALVNKILQSIEDYSGN